MPLQGLDRAPAPQLRTPCGCPLEDGFVQGAARKTESRKWQRRAGDDIGRAGPDAGDGAGVKCSQIDVQIAKLGGGRGADEFATNLVVRPALTLDHHDMPSGAGEIGGKRAAGDAAANDQRVSQKVAHVRRITPPR